MFRETRGFGNVDGSSIRPEEYVAYLHRVDKIDQIAGYKNLLFRVLSIRPLDQVLEVGCGTGVDMRSIFDRDSRVKKVVGVDNSKTMITNAIANTSPDLLESGKIEYVHGDAHVLHFEDDTFDASYSNRTFQHLENPRQALREMVRVTKPEGNIAIADPNWASLQIQGVKTETEGVIVKTFNGIIRNPYMGGQLHDFFLEEGITDTRVYGIPIVLSDFRNIQDVLWLDRSLQVAVDRGIISEMDAMRGLYELQRIDIGILEVSFDMFVVGGKVTKKLTNSSSREIL